MANAIVIHSLVLKKEDRSKIKLAMKKQEVSMDKKLLDYVTPKQRMKIPFAYKWLKFKTGFLGLVLARGVTR